MIKILERRKAGDKTEVYPGVYSEQYDDSLTVEIDMTAHPLHIYPSDVYKIIEDNNITYYFGSSTKRNGKKRIYIATYWKNSLVWN